MPTLYAIRALTIVDYHQMKDAGILRPDERVELVEGRLLVMPPVSGRHTWIIHRLQEILAHPMRGMNAVLVGAPIVLSDTSEAQPDLSVISHYGIHATTAPTAAETLMVVEVSDPASRVYDRAVKIPLYAASGIREAWIIDVEEETIEQYHSLVNGVYTFCRLWHPGDTVMSQFGIAVEVEAVMG